MKVDIYVLNFQGEGVIEPCVKSLQKAIEQSKNEVNLFVIDNGSTDLGLEFLKEKHAKKGEKVSIALEGLHHPKETKSETLPGMEKVKKKKVASKEDVKTSLYETPKEKPIAPEEKTHLKKGEKEVFPPPPHEKKEKPIQWSAQLPTHVESTTNAITVKAQPYLEAHPSVPLLFHQMVGTIILMRSRGVTTTEVVLNSPKFSSSDLFGARIVIEKYSTAPEAYNIRLIGNPRAVAIFDDNIEVCRQPLKIAHWIFQ